MIQLLIEVCSIDNLDIDSSEAYKSLLKIDPLAAKESIYTVLIPDDDDA